jgi:1,4-dihydroxy-2-naphthoate octaprenyltransferase
MRLFQFAKPIHLILALLVYVLGASVARYLGENLSFPVFALGFAACLLLLFSAELLSEYFRSLQEPYFPDETRVEREKFRAALLQAAVAALAVAALSFVVMLINGMLTSLALTFLAFIALASIAYSVPPIRFARKGFGELLIAILLGAFIPSFSFLLHVDQPHQLLRSITFALVPQALAYLIIFDLSRFASDQKYDRITLVTRLSWQTSITLHHVLLVLSYLLYAFFIANGLPSALIAPAFVTLPLAAAQIYWLNRIANGAPPVWGFIVLLAASTFGVTAYSLALTFWLR